MGKGLLILLVILLVGAVLIAFLPLRLAVGWADLPADRFAAQNITGSVWNGRMEGVTFGPVALGDFDAGLQPLPLLGGQMIFDVRRDPMPGDPGLRASLSKSGSVLSLSEVSTTLDLGRQLAPLPSAQVELIDFAVSFDGNRCVAASGDARLLLGTGVPGLILGQGLTGQVRCEDDRLLLPFRSVTGREEFALTLSGDGAYGGRLLLRGANPLWRVALPALGFRAVPGGYALRLEGRLQ